jgi:hypothetical protein
MKEKKPSLLNYYHEMILITGMKLITINLVNYRGEGFLQI